MANAMLTVRQVEAFLNRALADYEASSNADTREFFLLKVQVFIFLYDVATGMLSVGRNKPKGFAQAAALKTLVHSLFEYDQQMHRTLVPRILRYASRHKKPIDTSAIKAEKEKWRAQLRRLRAWKAVRDTATGHYGDIERQIELLKGSVRRRCFPLLVPFSSTRLLFWIYFLIGSAVPPNQRMQRANVRRGD